MQGIFQGFSTIFFSLFYKNIFLLLKNNFNRLSERGIISEKTENQKTNKKKQKKTIFQGSFKDFSRAILI